MLLNFSNQLHAKLTKSVYLITSIKIILSVTLFWFSSFWMIFYIGVRINIYFVYGVAICHLKHYINLFH